MTASAPGRAPSLDTTLLVFAIVCLAAAVTWIVPAGSFERETIEVEGVGTRDVVVPGTFEYLEQGSPQGIQDVLRAPIRGIIDAADIIAFVFLVGGAFAILAETGAIDAGLRSVIGWAERSPAVERALIPLFMTLFALGGAVFGMAEETLPFVLIFVPLARRLGYDTVTGFAIVMVGSQVGFAAAFLNPFTIGIAQGISGVPLFSGIAFRVVMWAVFVGVAIAFVMRYAARVRREPSTGLLWDEEAGAEVTDLGVATLADPAAGPAAEAGSGGSEGRVGAVLLTFGLGLSLLVWGVLTQGWYIEELSALFVGMGIVAGVVGGLSAGRISKAFSRGVRDLASTALLIGLARGILAVLEGGQVIDTILFGLAATMGGLGSLASAEAMLIMQSALNFFVPSGSGQAALTMPLMSQFADLVQVSRQSAVLAYQLGDGVTNLIIPTNYVIVGALGLVGIPWSRWARWILGLTVGLTGLSAVAVGIAVLIGY